MFFDDVEHDVDIDLVVFKSSGGGSDFVYDHF